MTNAIDTQLKVGREIYREGIRYFELNDITKAILKPIIAGDDKATDFENCLKTDPIVSRQIILDANLQLKNSSVESISHAVVLIGKNRVRDFIFSNFILSGTLQDQELIFKKISSEKKPLRYAEETEILAKKLGCDFSGGAWTSGFLFDILFHLLSHKKLTQLFELDFKQLWEHSARTAALSWSFANISKLSQSACRQAFLAGLSHEMGRALLWSVYPTESNEIQNQLRLIRKPLAPPRGLEFELEVEKRYLSISHCEVGSMLLVATEFMSEIEEVVAFHHDLELLKLRSSKHLQVAQCVSLADLVAELLVDKSKLTSEEITEALKLVKIPLNIQSSSVSAAIDGLRAKKLL